MRRILSLFLGAVSFSSQGVYADKKRKDAGTKLTRTKLARRTNKGNRNKDDVIEAIRDAKKKGHNVKVRKLRNGKLKVTIGCKVYVVSGLMVLAVLGLFGAYWRYHKSEEHKDQKEQGKEENKTKLGDKKEEEKLNQEDNKVENKEEEDKTELENGDKLQKKIDKSEEYALEQDGPREDMSNFIYNAFSKDSKKNTALVMGNFNYKFCFNNNGKKVGNEVQERKEARPFMPVLLSDEYFDGHITVEDFEKLKRGGFYIGKIPFRYYGVDYDMFKLSPGGAGYNQEMCKLTKDDLEKYSVSDIAFAMICNILHGKLECMREFIYDDDGNLKNRFRKIDYSGYFLDEDHDMKEPNFRLLLLESKVYLLKRKIEMLRGNGRVPELENKLKAAESDLKLAREHASELVKKKNDRIEHAKALKEKYERLAEEQRKKEEERRKKEKEQGENWEKQLVNVGLNDGNKNGYVSEEDSDIYSDDD